MSVTPPGPRGSPKLSKPWWLQNSSWSIRWLRSTLPCCSGQRGWMHRCRMPRRSTARTKLNGTPLGGVKFFTTGVHTSSCFRNDLTLGRWSCEPPRAMWSRARVWPATTEARE